MDLGTVALQLQSPSHIMPVHEFIEKMNTIFRNCSRFNPVGSSSVWTLFCCYFNSSTGAAKRYNVSEKFTGSWSRAKGLVLVSVCCEEVPAVLHKRYLVICKPARPEGNGFKLIFSTATHGTHWPVECSGFTSETAEETAMQNWP